MAHIALAVLSKFDNLAKICVLRVLQLEGANRCSGESERWSIRTGSINKLKLNNLRSGFLFGITERNKMQVQPYPILSLCYDESNLNHHLWNNNGTWYIAYTVLSSPITTERVRHSLNTKCILIARKKRDSLFKEVG